jgi:hypothetical protein
LSLKGHSHEIFDPRSFSSINPTWVTDQRVKIFLHMVANSQRNSRIFVDFALCRTARSSNSAQCRIARSRFSYSNRIEFLRKFKSIFKTDLAHGSGDPGLLFIEKNRGSKISWYCLFIFYISRSQNTCDRIFSPVILYRNAAGQTWLLWGGWAGRVCWPSWSCCSM